MIRYLLSSLRVPRARVYHHFSRNQGSRSFSSLPYVSPIVSRFLLPFGVAASFGLCLYAYNALYKGNTVAPEAVDFILRARKCAEINPSESISYYSKALALMMATGAEPLAVLPILVELGDIQLSARRLHPAEETFRRAEALCMELQRQARERKVPQRPQQLRLHLISLERLVATAELMDEAAKSKSGNRDTGSKQKASGTVPSLRSAATVRVLDYAYSSFSSVISGALLDLPANISLLEASQRETAATVGGGGRKTARSQEEKGGGTEAALESDLAGVFFNAAHARLEHLDIVETELLSNSEPTAADVSARTSGGPSASPPTNSSHAATSELLQAKKEISIALALLASAWKRKSHAIGLGEGAGLQAYYMGNSSSGSSSSSKRMNTSNNLRKMPLPESDAYDALVSLLLIDNSASSAPSRLSPSPALAGSTEDDNKHLLAAARLYREVDRCGKEWRVF